CVCEAVSPSQKLLGWLAELEEWDRLGPKGGLLDTLTQMNTVLEDIQKSLDMYLETKRHVFPRFYFLSNDDLLEILGQSRNPEAVQPHLKKCFDNIKLLRMQKVGGPGSKWEAMGMFSGDGEYVDFLHPVLLEGPVESWLGDVERTMRVTLRDLLRNCRLALKKFLNKRDKWVKEWAGQVVITASQIQWTADVTKCLLTAKERGDKKILKVMKKKQVSVLNKYSEAIRGSLTKIMRLKIVALVTIEVHARDVLERLYKAGLMDVSSFDWLSQLRFYWEKVPGPRRHPRPPGAAVPGPGSALGPVPSPEAGQLTAGAADRAQEGRGRW
ncbi:unnamed protein product, partial [Gulo gulo]